MKETQHESLEVRDQKPRTNESETAECKDNEPSIAEPALEEEHEANPPALNEEDAEEKNPPVEQTSSIRKKSNSISSSNYLSAEQPALGVLLHWLISDDKQLDYTLLNPKHLGNNLQSLLAITLLGLGLHGLCVGWLAQTTHVMGSSSIIAWMPLTLIVTFVGSMLICLPSFYFYTQLAGLNMSLAMVSVFATRTLAKTSVLMFGLLPFYFAFALSSRHTPLTSDDVVVAGLLLPFVVGYWGLRTLYYTFEMIHQNFPKDYQHRGNFLLRTVMAWGGIYMVVAPVAMYSMTQSFWQ